MRGDTEKFVLEVYQELQKTTYNYSYEEFAEEMEKSKLPILAGKDLKGNLHVYDMVEHPHLLIAGETGSGKSVTLRSILTSLILHKRQGLELYLADLKRSEFHVFRHIDIVKAVMTRKEDIYRCCVRLQKEMQERGDLLDAYEVAHIDDFNKLKDVEKKPYIVFCIDEFALLKKEKEIMAIIEEISCIGRALGVFLILSLQRPDAKIMEGQLKNNLTVRFAFQHSDKINSDITLGRGTKEDASKLERPGQFYIKNVEITELQAPFLDLEPAKELLEKIKIRKHQVNVNDEVIDIKADEVEEETFADLLPPFEFNLLEVEDDEGKRQSDFERSQNVSGSFQGSAD
ncbi:FtsK/SpoIIIE domain-containing protein [Fictibacillus sp. Mic-4]|uniref:FtsK/SpoIIIE domain-containing protein n=1 Tax=Fictibacillus sp. Mic-4 TaxID=3132826 RepID=UPI003CEE489F